MVKLYEKEHQWILHVYYINLLKISHLSTIFINRKHVPKQEMFTWEPI